MLQSNGERYHQVETILMNVDGDYLETIDIDLWSGYTFRYISRYLR